MTSVKFVTAFACPFTRIFFCTGKCGGGGLFKIFLGTDMSYPRWAEYSHKQTKNMWKKQKWFNNFWQWWCTLAPYFSQSSSWNLKPTQPPIRWVPGALSLGVKWPGC